MFKSIEVAKELYTTKKEHNKSATPLAVCIAVNRVGIPHSTL